MTVSRLLIANRGEIAIRIARAARELGITSVAVHSDDDADSPHPRYADEAATLGGSGPAAYLDIERLVSVARETKCDAMHPGYGFRSESAAFARACLAAGVIWVGPRPEILELLGNKAKGRQLAEECRVPVLPAVTGEVTEADASDLLDSLGPGGAVMVKAVGGGGGRGLRIVRERDRLADALERCRSEAERAFGNSSVMVEALLEPARHVEVQVVGDGSGRVVQLGDRDCSLQRRHQKLVEMAPAPALGEALRRDLRHSAVRMAEAVRFDGVGTFEFLVSVDAAAGNFAFIEANPRLQVEHTVTEEVTGVDLVVTQLRLARGESLDDLDLTVPETGTARGFAVQARVNLETLDADGVPRPTSGTLSTFELPGGAGIRVDTFGEAGLRLNPRFDSLLAKVVASTRLDAPAAAIDKDANALGELRIDGVDTNVALLRALLSHPDVRAGRWHTRFVDEHLGELLTAMPEPDAAALATEPDAALAPPLPVPVVAPPGSIGVPAPVPGTVVTVEVDEGDRVASGQQVVVLEAMKMEHVVAAPAGGIVRRLGVTTGDTVAAGQPLVFLEAADVEEAVQARAGDVDLDEIRHDLAEVVQRHEVTLDPARPEAVERRHGTGHRTARENLVDLCDPDSLVEYGPLVIAAQRQRRSVQELIERTPADGLVGGVGRVNGAQFGPTRSQCVVMSYDYMVLAGTQGVQNHRKKDRLFEVAERQRLPVVVFAEGGGGRPGDTDAATPAGLDCLAFWLYARLSGHVPLVAVVSGRCFAGNAALAGSSDVVIATADANLGMGGPAMIEGGGLGVFRPDDVGPMGDQVPNGVVDVLVDDERQAVAVAQQYLSYFQGSIAEWTCPDQRLLRRAVPENRLRVYDVRTVVETLADSESMLELRPGFGVGMVTALARIEGQPIGLIANNPTHLGGAIDSEGSDKAVRFMQLCDAFGLPIVFLCDTPGIMVGPEAERSGTVRHASRMFVTGANLSVPFGTVVLRKGYGLGAQAMAGGSFKAPVFCVSWPTGEFGGMGLEGAVQLGFRRELDAVEDPDERRALFDRMVARAYERGKALNYSTYFEIDDVIDPADTRRWVMTMLHGADVTPWWKTDGKRRPNVDTW